MPLPPELKPTAKQRVIDLMAEAGVDVSDWANYSDGSKGPAANPKYCYEWALMEPNRVLVCNLWYKHMREVDGAVEQRLVLRDASGHLETNPTRRARRARMEALVLQAYNHALPVRVIVLDGKPKEKADDGKAQVTARSLDPEPWAVVDHPSAGVFILRRGIVVARLTDQFSIPATLGSSPKSTTRTTKSWSRDPWVRQFALKRSGGKCEFCGKDGFRMSDGSIYLETHHVIPLSEGGPDSVTNVAALCPNHHREAHHGDAASKIRKQLLFMLEEGGEPNERSGRKTGQT